MVPPVRRVTFHGRPACKHCGMPGAQKGKGTLCRAQKLLPPGGSGVEALGSFQLAISSGIPQEVICAEYIPSARMRSRMRAPIRHGPHKAAVQPGRNPVAADQVGLIVFLERRSGKGGRCASTTVPPLAKIKLCACHEDKHCRHPRRSARPRTSTVGPPA